MFSAVVVACFAAIVSVTDAVDVTRLGWTMTFTTWMLNKETEVQLLLSPRLIILDLPSFSVHLLAIQPMVLLLPKFDSSHIDINVPSTIRIGNN